MHEPVTFANYQEEVIPPPKGKSKTQPNMTLTLGQMFLRHSQGQLTEGMKQLQYTGDIELPNLARMDLVDIDKYRENLKGRIDHLNEQYTIMQEKAQKAREAQLKEKRDMQEFQAAWTLEKQKKAQQAAGGALEG